jgi:hypothetical protein
MIRKPRPPTKVKYIETFPEEMELVFDDAFQYHIFWEQRHSIVSKKLDFYNPLSKYKWDDWKYQRVTLKQDGTPRKKFYPKQLFTKNARDKQAKNFKAFKKSQYEENQRIKLALEQKKKEILELIGAHGFDLDEIRLTIVRKRRT